MKTILFLIRLFINPFKVFYELMTKKERKTHFLAKPLKYCFIGLMGIIVIIILVLAIEDSEEDSFTFGRETGVAINLVDGVKKEKELNEDNPNGTTNGLNLQLIDNIQTEGFVKDYLTLLRDYSNGKITSNPGLPVDTVIGSSVSESNTYYGTPLPKTYLPWDDSANSPYWNKPIGNVPAEGTKLRTANKNVLNIDHLPYAKGPLYSNVIAVGAAGEDNSVTPFQINHFDSSGYKKSLINGYKESSNRSIDASYFPDSLSALSDRFKNNVLDLVPVAEDLDNNSVIAMYSAQHNPGPGGLTNDFLNFVNRNDINDVKKQCDVFVNDLAIIDKKYGHVLSNIGTGGVGRAFVALALINECGWKYFDLYGTPSLLQEFGSLFEETTGKSVSSVMQGNRADIPSYARGRAGASSYTGLTKTTSDGVSVRLDSIAMYHMWQYLYGGKYYYAKMLQYAGVNVDPTNPNTYMNTLKEGEWKPSGESIWMTSEGVDMNKLTKQGEKILNQGRKFLGLPYIYGGNDPTKGLDCSSFVQWTYRNSFGIELPRVTYPQVRATKRIENSEARPGDLVFYYTTSNRNPDTAEHVAIYMGMDNGRPRIMHAPLPGDVIKITTWAGEGAYVTWDIRRVEGINE